MLLVLCPISELDIILKLNLTSQQELAIPFVFEKGVQVGRFKKHVHYRYTIFLEYIQNVYFSHLQKSAMFKILVHLSPGR